MKNLSYLFLILLVSCIETIEWPGDNESTGRIVIEGEITTDTTAHTVYVSRTQPVIVDSQSEPVPGAVVSIESDSRSYILREVSPGVYQTDSSAFGVVGERYLLQVIIDEEIYEANADLIPLEFVPDPVEVRSVIFSPPNQPAREVLQFIYPSNFGSEVPARYQVSVRIPDNADSLIASGYEAPRWLLHELEMNNFVVSDTSYYMHPGLEPPAIFAYGETNESRLSFPGTTIIEEYYSMTPEHYAFVRSVLSETEWRGLGPFGFIPGVVVGNISNEGFGYFSASQVVRLEQVPVKQDQ